MSKQIESEIEIPAGGRHQDVLKKLGDELPKERLTWLAGYFFGQAEANLKLADLFKNLLPVDAAMQLTEQLNAPANPRPDVKQAESKSLTILYGSCTGNGAGFAKQARQIAETSGYQVKLVNMADYKVRDLKNERKLLIIVSTHGNGVPPFSAEELYEFIHSARAPKLPDLQYSVLALGDKRYFHFCKTGIDFDNRLEELGAERIYKRTDCTVNFKHDAVNWLCDSLLAFDTIYSGVGAGSDKIGAKKNSLLAKPEKYDEDHPFEAEIIKKINLNGRGSNKETCHVELLISGSDVQYKPGDSVVVKVSNPDEQVKKLLEASLFTGNEKVQTQKGGVNLKDALKENFELSAISSDTVRKHNKKAKSEDLQQIISDPEAINNFISGHDIVELLQNYPVKYTPDEFVAILRPLSARLYSIASSQQAYEDELHIAVGTVRFADDGRKKEGCRSTFFADRINEGDKVSIYIKPNESFRLPEDNDTHIIMVGTGTGIVPFRAFVDERAKTGAKGKNWLIYGDQYFTTDFLYQTEWHVHLKSGVLTKMDVAFSRDHEEKVYVQHKILSSSKEIYKWLNNNAYVYVCGNKYDIAADVYNTFVELVQKEASMNKEEAIEFMKNMKMRGKYCEDVH